MIIKKPPGAAPVTKSHITSVYGQDPYYFTVEELLTMCKNQGVPIPKKYNKDDLIEILTNTGIFNSSKGFTMVVK